MKKIKVLHIHTLPVVSGSGINTLLTMAGLNKDKYEVEFACCPGGPLVDEVLKQGIKFHPIRHLVQRISPRNDLMALWELACLMKRSAYDIVHTHNSKAGFLGRVAAKIAGRAKIIHTIHGFAFHELEKPPRKILFVWLERIVSKFTDRLITISAPLCKWGLASGIGQPQQYITIYSGIEIEKFKPPLNIAEKKRQLGLSLDNKVVGVVSKLWEGKGHHYILQAAKTVVAALPKVKFLFVGEGYLRKKLAAETERLGLKEYVVFMGFRPDIPEITATFDISLLASEYEGMGRVLLEAMALAKPVIASGVGGIVDVVDDGETGLLVPAGDVARLASALLRLLLDEQLCQRMGEAGRKKIDARFSAKTMVAQIERVYEEL